MERELKRQKRTVGSIVEIPLENGYKTYARILDDFMAFYNIYTKQKPDIEVIISSPVLFMAAIYDSAILNGYWLKIGKKLPLKKHLLEIPPFYIQDFLHPDNYTIYKSGKEIPAKKEDCKGLEYLAVWKPEKIEKRLNDHFTGKENKTINQIQQAEVFSHKISIPKKIKTHKINREAV